MRWTKRLLSNKFKMNVDEVIVALQIDPPLHY